MSKKEKKEKKNAEPQETVTEQPVAVANLEEQQESAISPEEARIMELEAEVERLSKELVEEKETYLRKFADMDNYRKRLVREKETAVQYANERLLNDLIPILDDFDRAVDAGEQSVDVKTYSEGIKLIRKQLLDTLDRNWGLKRMDGIVGKEFSPHEHEAMMMEEDEKFDSETVLAELQKGYYLHDRVLRTAKVKVGKPL
ncbi:nucleotide exchange factor GrpE [Pleomorphochaeta sp. DL1XJH-081]|jgi:molecular chaperone GrpE|uniref:nucleotide exchange factor GrpE n=1 Tax=Pleomorphochaeta sp. DL1XJH-081 TaxID=3409690 RepID=UPI003BB70715